MLKTHKTDFEEFGKVMFQTRPLPSGQREKIALLNEDQAFLLLTYSRNTAKVRALKIKRSRHSLRPAAPSNCAKPSICRPITQCVTRFTPCRLVRAARVTSALQLRPAGE